MCSKKPYKTREEAENFSRFNKILRPEKPFQRAYPCHKCGRWHLSKQKGKNNLPFLINLDPLKELK